MLDTVFDGCDSEGDGDSNSGGNVMVMWLAVVIDVMVVM